MIRALSTTVALLAAGFAAIQLVPQAVGQTGPGWVTLTDGKTMGDWNSTGEANWRIEDGALVADKGKGGHLVTKNSYKNFQINAEFWADEEANSGIFIRCKDPTAIGARTCYEVNIFDKRPDPSYGTGSIVYFAEVNPMPKAAGKWNTFEITADGRHLSWCSTDRKPSTSGMACSKRGTSRCNTARALSNSARLRSSHFSARSAGRLAYAESDPGGRGLRLF